MTFSFILSSCHLIRQLLPPCRDPPDVLAPDHQLPPQPGYMRQHATEPPEVEELAFAVGAMIVVNRHLSEIEAGVLQLLDQLKADRAIGRLQVDHVEDLAPQQAEVAVDIAQLETEHELHKMVVHSPDHDAVQRVVPLDLPAVDYIHAVGHGGPPP